MERKVIISLSAAVTIIGIVLNPLIISIVMVQGYKIITGENGELVKVDTTAKEVQLRLLVKYGILMPSYEGDNSYINSIDFFNCAEKEIAKDSQTTSSEIETICEQKVEDSIIRSECIGDNFEEAQKHPENYDPNLSDAEVQNEYEKLFTPTDECLKDDDGN
jgi:hypothetical protein